MSQLTMDDFPQGFNLKHLVYAHCGRDEVRMWERYFQGDFDPDVRLNFENAINPVSRTTAIMLRGFLWVLREPYMPNPPGR